MLSTGFIRAKINGVVLKHLMGQHNQKSHGNRGASIKHDFLVQDNVVGAGYGQVDSRMTLRTKDGRIAATLDYSIYDNKPSIKMVESHISGLGAGAAAVSELAKEYGYRNIQWGMMTADGKRLRDKMDKQFNIERVTEKINGSELAKKSGGRVISDDENSVYAHFTDRKMAREYIAKIKRIYKKTDGEFDSDNIDIQIDGKNVYIDAPIPIEISYIRG